MNLQTMNGIVVITDLRKERSEEEIPVYNFRVSEWSSYFVSEWNVYVHNGKGYMGGSGTAGKWTLPSQHPNILAKPGGKKTKINYNDPDLDNIRSLIRENEAAEVLAKNGYKVEQNPNIAGSKNPDYLIENKVFDCYSPKDGTNVRNIASNIGGKINSGQTDRIILNLDDWHGGGGDINELIKQLNEWPITGLKEVKVINHYHEVINIYP